MKLGILIFFVIVVSICNAQASPGECYLSVDRKIYFDGACNLMMSKDGSFSIGAAELNKRRSRHFASVNIVEPHDGEAVGYWNGVHAESHAHDDLGKLTRKGGCWANSRMKVCAWRPGTKPDLF